MTMIDAATGELCMWVVFDKPGDFPDKFVARLFVLDKPSEALLIADTLGELRGLLTRLYPDLTVLPRNPYDDPPIVEVWL